MAELKEMWKPMIKDIILCGECKHLTTKIINGVLKGFCYIYGGSVKEENYCFKAEKRVENETENIQQK